MTTAWTDHLARAKNGVPRPLFRNAVTALRECPSMFGVLGYDGFSCRTMLLSMPPWEMSNLGWQARPWSAQDDLACCDWLQRHDIAVPVSVTAEAVELVARDRTYHPVIEYLQDCKWDGVKRLNTLMAVYFGAKNSPYSRAVGRMLMIAAVARVIDPGCKVDTLPVLEGKQGLGKSTAIRVLSDPWFTDEIADLGSKDAAMQAGAWCIEIAELDAMSKAEVAKVKAFLSRSSDRFRPPYGRHVVERPRSCVFFGSTNNRDYLKDATGGRRFFPVAVRVDAPIDVNGLVADRDKLWAEALEAYQRGEAWWLSDPKAEAMIEALEEQEARYQVDPWEQLIADYLSSRLHQPPQHPAFRVDISTVFRNAIGMEIKAAWDQAAMNRIAKILHRLGWSRKQIYIEVSVQGRTEMKRAWFYVRPPTEEELETDRRTESENGDSCACTVQAFTSGKDSAPD